MTRTVFEAKYVKSWSSLVAGDAVSYLPNGQSNLVIGLFPLSVLFCNFINTAAYHWADVSLNLLLAVMLPNKICWKMNWCLVHLKRIHWLCCRWTIIQTYYLPTYLHWYPTKCRYGGMDAIATKCHILIDRETKMNASW